MSEQPPPIHSTGPALWDVVIDLMRQRDQIGLERYGMRLRAFNGRDALRDTRDELLDAVVYLTQEIEERTFLQAEVERLQCVITSLTEQITRQGGIPTRMANRKRVKVTLCGSTRFKQTFIDANFRETKAGKIVLSVGFFSHADAAVYTLTEDEKRMADELHIDKIDDSDEVLFLNVDDYIGDSTRRELAHARASGKKVRWLVLPSEYALPGEGN